MSSVLENTHCNFRLSRPVNWPLTGGSPGSGSAITVSLITYAFKHINHFISATYTSLAAPDCLLPTPDVALVWIPSTPNAARQVLQIAIVWGHFRYSLSPSTRESNAFGGILLLWTVGWPLPLLGPWLLGVLQARFSRVKFLCWPARPSFRDPPFHITFF
jgi:hypothetical protein